VTAHRAVHLPRGGVAASREAAATLRANFGDLVRNVLAAPHVDAQDGQSLSN
jgi:hypothetical protein